MMSSLNSVHLAITGLTLASQWKSQFDDSEETTDNEWKGENLPSPEHRNTPNLQVSTSYPCLCHKMCQLCHNQL